MTAKRARERRIEKAQPGYRIQPAWSPTEAETTAIFATLDKYQHNERLCARDIPAEDYRLLYKSGLWAVEFPNDLDEDTWLGVIVKVRLPNPFPTQT